ncbi:MAG: tryptophan 7-halogenase [Xanthomonadaceae bacterium]|nr:tryptophan 7-halogenase [Xanthomonadaceae bacterium]MDP2184928.1 tryptophan 7-halogenase [Xanthomonadales bacterium]MDZ4115928.1 tryptophan halogenase family protein [Xanthomonadaceae bacterium]MDZ4378162.1 tryptophan halogenase family protein [Xanthomonadaceae bacterium]
MRIGTTPLRIVIVGGGTAGWMAANLLAQRWRERNVDITLLESPEIGIVGVGEGSTPLLGKFFETLGIADSDWMPKCNATYKNGIRFSGWSQVKGYESYFHPFASAIDIHGQAAFFMHCAMRRSGYDVAANPDRFYLAAELARQRLAPLAAHHFPFRILHGYHFDAHLVGALLGEHAQRNGVDHLQGKVETIERGEDGAVVAVITEDARRIEGDFFVDCSGFRSLIVQQALAVPFKPFSDNLFNDRAVVLPTPTDPTGTNSQTISTALRNGWAWSIPLRHRHGNGYVYSSRFCTPDQAEQELREHLGLLDDPVGARHLQMRVGRVEQVWTHNCLAVGLSQGFIEPLEATALHLVQTTLESFIEHVERDGDLEARRQSFNAGIARDFEGVRDYIVCHYRMNRRTDTEYWRANAGHDQLSDSLKAILTCWFTGQNLEQELARQGIADIYPAMSWHCLLAGYGQFPDAARLRSPEPGIGKADMAAIDDFRSRCALNFRDHAKVLSEMAA